MPTHQHTAFLALGANDSPDIEVLIKRLRGAVAMLTQSDTSLTAHSAFYQTPAFPAGSGPDFVNAALCVTTPLSAPDLLHRLHEIEAAYGRKRIERWGVRSLDIDLLSHDEQILPDKATYQAWHDMALAQQQTQTPACLIIPHPRLHERGFVLRPLAQIAPDWVHPVLKRTAQELLENLPRAQTQNITKLAHSF